MKKLTPVQAIREYWKDDPRPVSIKEMKDLSAEERLELGGLACKELGATLVPPKQL